MFGGWAFPGIPGNARLLQLGGLVAVPAAGATSYVTGTAPLGGTSFLVSRRALDARGKPHRVAVLAGGVGLVDYGATLGLAVSIGAGVTNSILSMLGLGSTVTQFDELVVEAPTIGLVLRDSAGGQLWGGNAGPSNAFRRVNVSVPTTWEVNNPTAGALTVYITAVRRVEAAARFLTVNLVKWPIDASAAPGVVVGSTPSKVPAGEALPANPDPIEVGGSPLIVPVVTTDSMATLATDEAYGIAVTAAGSSPLPASSYCVARLLCAAWPEVEGQ